MNGRGENGGGDTERERLEAERGVCVCGEGSPLRSPPAGPQSDAMRSISASPRREEPAAPAGSGDEDGGGGPGGG